MNGSQRTPANTRTPCAAPPSTSLTRNSTVSPPGVVHVPFCSTRSSPSACVWRENTQSNTNSSRVRDKRNGIVPFTRAERAQPEAIHEALRERVERLCERQRVHHQHESPGRLGTRKCVHVGDVRNRVGQSSRPGDVIRHRSSLSASPVRRASRRPRPATASTPGAPAPQPHRDGRAPAGRPR